MHRNLFLILCLSVLGASPVAVSQETPEEAPPTTTEEQAPEAEIAPWSTRLELTLRGWNTNFDADTSLLREITGSRVDIAEVLDMDPGTIPEIRLRWRIAEHHSLTAAYLGVDESSHQALFRPFILNDGITAPIGDLKADLSLDYYRLGWRWEVGGRKSEKFDLETILDLAILDVDASYRHQGLFLPLFTSEDSVGGTVPLPLIGLRAEFRPVTRLGIYGEVAGMVAGNYGDIIDAEFGLRGYLGKHVTAEAGYRIFEVSGSDDDDSADIQLSGPFVGFGVRF